MSKKAQVPTGLVSSVQGRTVRFGDIEVGQVITHFADGTPIATDQMVVLASASEFLTVATGDAPAAE
jgi:hypothetical protein